MTRLDSTRKQTAQLSLCGTVIYDAFHRRGWHRMDTYAEHLFERTRSKYQPRSQVNVEKYSKRMVWVHHLPLLPQQLFVSSLDCV